MLVSIAYLRFKLVGPEADMLTFLEAFLGSKKPEGLDQLSVFDRSAILNKSASDIRLSIRSALWANNTGMVKQRRSLNNLSDNPKIVEFLQLFKHFLNLHNLSDEQVLIVNSGSFGNLMKYTLAFNSKTITITHQSMYYTPRIGICNVVSNQAHVSFFSCRRHLGRR